MVDDAMVIAEDWRLHFCTRIVSVSKRARGSTMQAGDPIKTVANVLYGRDPLVLGVPNGTALFLDMSFKQYKIAKTLLMSCVPQRLAARERYVPDNLSFDFFEAIMAAIVFGYTSLESFANEEIPEEFYYEKKFKKIWLALGKQNIERRVDLQTKLKDIIPKVHNLKSVSSSSIWKEFLELEETRNLIIHLKTIDRHALADETGSIWHKLFTPNLICPHYVAKQLMLNYYSQMKHRPRWSQLVPF